MSILPFNRRFFFSNQDSGRRASVMLKIEKIQNHSSDLCKGYFWNVKFIGDVHFTIQSQVFSNQDGGRRPC